MIVKNMTCNDISFVDGVIDELIKNNIDYLLIENYNHVELHFDKYI